MYYVGLLAGENDIELVENTLFGRNGNRHYDDLDEIDNDIQKPVVQRLLRLMAFRNTYPAFNVELSIEDSPENELILARSRGKYQATVHIDLDDYKTVVT